MNLFDSSALLSLLLDEDGAEVVEAQLDQPSRCSVVNWSEIAQKAAARGLNWTTTRELLLGWDLVVEPMSVGDAERAAHLWVERPELSMADRVCLATAQRLQATVWTADRVWGESPTIRQIRP